jgi:hypothetical protein
MSVYSILLEIQAELKAPKSQLNKFGGYQYRSCEDILEAAKPLLKKNGCSITLSDEVIQIGSRFYIKSFARLRDVEGAIIETCAFAREPEIQKGMSESQITGATSSYARKYALNGLLAIDDTRDIDSGRGKAPVETMPSVEEMKEIKTLLEEIIALPNKEKAIELKNRIKELVDSGKLTPSQTKILREAFKNKNEELEK